MSIYTYNLDSIEIGKLINNYQLYLEVKNLKVKLPKLKSLNGVCQKINSSIKKAIFFFDLKIDIQEYQGLINIITQIEQKIINQLSTEHLEKSCYLFGDLFEHEHIKNLFRTCLLNSDEGYFYLRVKLPHDDIQFLDSIITENESLFQKLNCDSEIECTIECPGIWFQNNQVGLAWNLVERIQ